MRPFERFSRSAPRAGALAVLTSLAVVACSESVVQVGEDDVVTLRVTPDSSAMAVGRTLQLRAFGLDETGAAIQGLDFSWSSADPGVATVDETGLVTGVTTGDVEIVATGAGTTGSAVVTVALPPTIVLSDDSVHFSGTAGGADPAPADVNITNGGFFALEGLAVDSIVPATATWIATVFDQTAAPATLTFSPMIAGLTAAGTYTADVCISGLDASQECVTVALDIGPGAAASASVSVGDGQTAEVGTDVGVAPSVLVEDAFGNPVPGVQVVFAATQGGGSVTGGTVTTDSVGIATAGAWTLGMTAGANQLSATPSGLSAVTFSATGTPGAAANLVLEDGDAQNAVAGSDVTTAPAVKAIDAFGNGVAGVAVTFQVASGGGAVTGATASTDAAGVATLGSWTLGSTAGVNTLLATSGAVTDSVTFTATGISGAAVAIQLEGGDMQTDTVGATLSTAYAVKVVDVNGNGVAGVSVSWSVTGGGGSVAATSMTDAGGVASVSRVLGTTAGTQTAQGGVGGLANSPIAFTATATPATPVSIAANAGTGQNATAGTAVATAPSVLIQDQFGNVVPGESVTFAVTSAGGSVSGGAATTDASGVAQVTSWTLGTVAAMNSDTLQATSAAGTFGFVATADPDVAAAIAVSSGDNQTAITGNNVANMPTVTVTDQYGNLVPGETVDFAASGSGSAGSASVVTNGSGQAATTWTVDVGGSAMQSDGTFPNTLTATVSGTAISATVGADAIYSFVQHVNPLWVAESCTGCHGTGSFTGFELNGTAAANYTSLITNDAICDAGSLGANVRRVSTVGGAIAADSYSVLLGYLEGTPLGGGCDSNIMDFIPSNAAIVRAWIQNGAPNN